MTAWIQHCDVPSQPRTTVWAELKRHIPFPLIGTLSGVVIAAVLIALHLPRAWTTGAFWALHSLHVLLGAMATTSLYRRWAKAGWVSSFAVGYLGAIGIATLSDCVIPYTGEWLIGLPNRGVHIGFLEMWWLVNPLAVVGILLSWVLPGSTMPHAGHVLLSTWASLMHIQMAMGEQVGLAAALVLPGLIFLAVWVPCCTSDIMLPVLFSRVGARSRGQRSHARNEKEGQGTP